MAQVSVDQRFSGLAETADFQMIDVRIPETESPNRYPSFLRILRARSYKIPVTCAGVAPGPASADDILRQAQQIILIADDHVSDAAPSVLIPLAPSNKEVAFVSGRRSFTLISAPSDKAHLEISGDRVVAHASSMIAVTISYRIILYASRPRPGPQELDISIDALASAGASIELRDVTGNVVLSRLTKPRPAVGTPVRTRHQDSWVIDALFDKDFYLSGFPKGTAVPDPVSHFLSKAGSKAAIQPHGSRCALSGDAPRRCRSRNEPVRTLLCRRKAGRQNLAKLGTGADGGVYRAHAEAVSPGPFFEEFDPTIGIGRRRRAKVLTYYLPQFTPLTSMTSIGGRALLSGGTFLVVCRASRHVQPRIPRDLGCYSLAEGDTMRRQIDMARAAGVFGFCFYHYWFDGQRVLETPMERFLEDPTLDFPFCLMWANENWTRTWDGSDKEIILQQTYRTEDVHCVCR